MLGAEINHVVIVYTQMYDVKLQKKIHTAECIQQRSVHFSVHHILSLKQMLAKLRLLMQYIFLKYTYTKNFPNFTLTLKVYFHAPKCTFNPDPIWDQNWNFMDPCSLLITHTYETKLVYKTVKSTHFKYFVSQRLRSKGKIPLCYRKNCSI